MISRLITASLSLALCTIAAAVDPTTTSLSAKDIARRLNTSQQDGASYVRLRMVVKESASDTGKKTLQLQVKSNRTKETTDILYQVLWPKERKGEGVLLKKTGERFTNGWIFTPPNNLRRLQASQLGESLFGSDLSYDDLVGNFLAWENQAIVGTEEINGVSCTILESKPSKEDRSSSGPTRTWVDIRRFVPLRIEKYRADGKLLRRIDIVNVVTDDIGRQIPANLEVRSSGDNSVTELDGSRIKHGITYGDGQFTAAGLQEVAVPRSAPE